MGNVKKIAIIIGTVLVAALAIVAYMALWTGSTEEIEAVADRFQPDSSWTLVSEQIRPPRYLCLDGGTCPAINRTWAMTKPLTKGQFSEAISRTYEAEITGNCPEVIPDEIYTQYNCFANGIMNGYRINIIYSINPDLDNQYQLTINIREDAA